MVFTTHIFVFYFLPAVLFAYYAIPPVGRMARLSPEAVSRSRNALLLAASYVFYGWWNPWFVLLMLLVTLANYACGEAIARPGASRLRRKRALAAAVAVSLGTLAVFKYLVFFQVNLNEVLTRCGAGSLPVLQIALPVGISFYTFQALSYSIDVYRGTAPPARSLADFACYIALFPQLVAGPIVRYHTVAEQLVGRSHTLERFASGVALFVLGFAKKVLLANPLGSVADAAFAASGLTAFDAWLGVTAYAFQIYFDFCGYSDMAVGLGRMLGFEFMKNFDAPYRAESITEFWRRWHISLSTFLRDYLYIPLGGSRRGAGRTYLNLGLVMLLGGLWHGANWTFVAWGAFHGLLLAGERRLGRQTLYRALPRPARVAVTFALVLISWVLFRSESLGAAGDYLKTMFGMGGGGEGAFFVAAYLYQPTPVALMLLCAALVAAPLQAHQWSERITWPKALVLAPAFLLALLAMFTQAFNPFLYFQF